MEPLQELNKKEIEQVSGALLANALGAIAGGVGGFYGSIIGGGRSATFSSIAKGTFAGMVVGAISPVRGITSAVTTVGGGVISGGVVSVLDDIEEISEFSY
ncbi:hypothetical protein D210916BOD24_28970 [Alteromonas sp. D210916BOD_24]|uniref:hypothetical protein n=1 Tax=Alteromonas sp. D210916BOD_24 TaxID=3157618 RepID=UPI00399C5634